MRMCQSEISRLWNTMGQLSALADQDGGPQGALVPVPKPVTDCRTTKKMGIRVSFLSLANVDFYRLK